MILIYENKHIQDVWIEGWLKNKPYCYNYKHKNFNPLIDKVVKNLNIGLNQIIVVVGTPRSGKSFFSFWLMAYMNYCYFSREEYKPEKDNISPLKDVYWSLDDFINATKNPENQNKFITLEEQGVEQYKMSFFDEKTINFDKLTQIFGIDNTNLILNLPYIFDIFKGTRLKAHLLLRAIRKTKDRVNIILCEKKLNTVTDKAWFQPLDTWENAPNVYNIYPKFIEEYIKMKLDYNLKKKILLGGKRAILEENKKNWIDNPFTK